MAARYWCHLCSQMVNPTIDAEIKCPFCQSGFIEEMIGEIISGSSNSLREVQDAEVDFSSDRSLSLWAPILLGTMNNPRRPSRFRRTEFGVDNDDVNNAADFDGNNSNIGNHSRHHGRHSHRQHGGEINLEREFESILRRRRSSATILELLQDIRAGITSENDNSNLFNQSVQRSIGLNQNWNNSSLSAIGDYFDESRYDDILDHLAENNPMRQGTLPAQKEAVENLPTVKIYEPLQCSVCLDDFDKGSQAKEMPCKHKVHNRCIAPWLELHSSCPVCRSELPPYDDTKVVPVSNENVEDDGNGSERRFSFPWPFSGLFSSSSASASGSSRENS